MTGTSSSGTKEPTSKSEKTSLGSLFVEGLGGTRFELNEVPLTTRIREIAEALLAESRNAASGRLSATSSALGPPTVYLLRSGMPRRLPPDATVEESGVRSGDQLRLIPTPKKRCLARLYRGGGTLHADALRAGLPPKTVPLQLEKTTYVDRTLHELERCAALPELFVLAALHWPEDDELRRMLSLLAAEAEQPREVAPRAWIGMTNDDHARVLRLWQEVLEQ